MKKATQKFLKSPSILTALFATLVIAISVVGLLLLQQPLSESQDIRQQASVADGKVEISYQAMTGQRLKVGEPVEVVLAVNTNGTLTNGVQVVFNVVTNVFNTMTADVITQTGLQSASTQIERTSDGFLVGALALPAQIGQSFSTTTNVSFLKIGFTPTRAGTIEFNFDREHSIVTTHNSNPPTDQLMHVSGLVLTVVNPAGSPSPTPSVSPSPSPSVSPSPSPTATPATGGVRVVSCNTSCTSNSQCGVNQRCYSVGNGSRCRLATNPTDANCAVANAGPNYSCNQYCADTTECAAGLSCWNNQCRRPENIQSTTCAALTQTQRQQLAASCNASCTSNAGCATNLRCYMGSCRLATNPSSTSCTPETVSSVSKTYGAAPKGDTSEIDDKTTTTTKTATPAASANPAATTSAILDEAATPTPIYPAAQPTENVVPEDETALDLLKSMLQTPESALPLIVIGSGLGLLFLALLALVIKSLFGKRGGSSKPTTSRPTQKPPMHPTPVEKAQAAVQTTINVPTPQVATQPTSSSPTTQPAITLSPTTARNMTSPTASTPSSSMLERMKQKGIKAPTSGQS